MASFSLKPCSVDKRPLLKIVDGTRYSGQGACGRTRFLVRAPGGAGDLNENPDRGERFLVRVPRGGALTKNVIKGNTIFSEGAVPAYL